MKLDGSYQFSAPLDGVWARLQDPVSLAQGMPDCERLHAAGAGRYVGTLLIHAGPVQSRFTGMVTAVPTPSTYTLELTGDGHSSDSRVWGYGRLWLEAGLSGTALHYNVSLEVAGAIADLGTSYLETISRSLIRQNLTWLENSLKETAVSPFPENTPPARWRALQRGVLPVGLAFTGLLLLRGLYHRWLRHLARQVARILSQA